MRKVYYKKIIIKHLHDKLSKDMYMFKKPFLEALIIDKLKMIPFYWFPATGKGTCVLLKTIDSTKELKTKLYDIKKNIEANKKDIN